MTDQEFIRANLESGEEDFDGEMVPWIAVPNRPGREPFTVEEILEALKDD